MDCSNCTINYHLLATTICFDFFTETDYLVFLLCSARETSDSYQANSVYLAKTPTYYLHTLQYSYFMPPCFVVDSAECCQSFLLSSLWSSLLEHSWRLTASSYLLWYHAVEQVFQQDYLLHPRCSECHFSDYFPEICGSSMGPSLALTDSIADLIRYDHEIGFPRSRRQTH